MIIDDMLWPVTALMTVHYVTVINSCMQSCRIYIYTLYIQSFLISCKSITDRNVTYLFWTFLHFLLVCQLGK